MTAEYASRGSLSNVLGAGFEFSPEGWRTDAELVLLHLAEGGDVFTVDNLRELGVPDPDKPQRWGALIAVMQRRGIIEFAGLHLHRITAGDVQAIRQWKGTRRASGWSM